MSHLRALGILLTIALVAMWPPQVHAQASLQFCREVPPDFNCVGATSTFQTLDRRVWVLILLPQPGPYEIKVDWNAPDGATYGTSTFRHDRNSATRWRFSLSVRAERAETLPGEWTVRVLIDGRLVATGKFTLQLVGPLKVFVPSVGPVAVRAAFTKTRPGSQPPEEDISTFSLQDEIYAYVVFSSEPLERATTVVPKVRWLREGVEVHQWESRLRTWCWLDGVLVEQFVAARKDGGGEVRSGMVPGSNARRDQNDRRREQLMLDRVAGLVPGGRALCESRERRIEGDV